MKNFVRINSLLLIILATVEIASAQSAELNIAKQAILGYDEVTDAAINKKGRNMSLVLIVKYSTSEQRAKELGDNFVRLTMTFVKEENSPSKEIGTSVYDYLIGVYYPNEKEVVMGAKVTFAKKITW